MNKEEGEGVLPWKDGGSDHDNIILNKILPIVKAKFGSSIWVGKNDFNSEDCLVVARKDTSTIQIINKQDLHRALTNREMFDIILNKDLIM